MKKILVTGGAGFIGSHLVDRLIEEGYAVMVLDNLSRGSLENINAKADFEKIDVTSKKFLELMKKITPDIIFHLAAQSDIGQSLKNSRKDIAVNFLATQTLLEQAKVLKIKKIIFASSAAVYAESKKLPVDEENIKEPISLYGASKLLSEYLLQNYHKIRGLPYTSLRFANVYGPKQDTSAEGGVVAIFIDKILRNNQVTIFGDGMQTRDFIYVSDIVEACLLSLSNKVTGEFNIGTTQETSILSLYKKLLDLSGAKDNKKFTKRRFLEVARNSLSSEKFKNTTVWKPQVNLTHGLKLTFDYFQKNLNSLAEQRQL